MASLADCGCSSSSSSSLADWRMRGAWLKFSLILVLIGASGVMIPGVDGLSVGYYKSTCASAESTIQKAVAAAFQTDKHTSAGLLRLHFHDCFVNGCDGSVLVDSKGSNTAEKDGPGNANSLRGFEVVDTIKTQLEAACPGVVSCADILAYAARDGVVLAGGRSWGVEGGRRDGRRSSSGDLRGNLPPPIFNVAQLTSLFAAKGLSQDEMVTLSGAHSIGQAHCAAFANRINASNPDTTLDPTYAKTLGQACPAGAPASRRVNMESTPVKFDSRFYSDLLQNRGLFTSDQVLASNAATRPAVKANANSQTNFFTKFGKAMVHMGRLPVPSTIPTEIRRNCRVFNS